MTTFEKPADFPDRGLFGAQGLPSAAPIKAVLLLALLIACGVGFAMLCPLGQASASKSGAEGNETMLFVAP